MKKSLFFLFLLLTSSFANAANRCVDLFNFDENFPAYLISTVYQDPYESAYEMYSSQEEIVRRQFVAQRKAMIAAQDRRRASWAKADLNLAGMPYSFEEIQERSIPIYIDGMTAYKRGFSLHDFYLPPKIDRLHTSGLLLRVRDGLDMVSWDPTRFPSHLPHIGGTVSIFSFASAREAFLNPLKKQRIDYVEVQITQVSDQQVVLTKNKFYDYRSSHSQSFITAYGNTLKDDTYSLVEVDGMPMLAGPELAANELIGAPQWSEALYRQSRVWKAANPDIPFMVGRDVEGKYHVVYPLFKIHTAYLFENLETDQWQQIDASLTRIDSELGSEEGFRVGVGNPSSILGRLLNYRFITADFGPAGFRFVDLSTQTLGVMKHAKNNNLHLEGNIFKYTNLIRANLLTQTSSSARAEHLAMLASSERYEDWFETVYWLSMEEVRTALKGVSHIPITTQYTLVTGEGASVLARDWVSPRSLRRHYEKHGLPEMGFQSEADYFSSAKDFFADTSSSQILITRLSVTSRVKYNFATREFGVIRDDGMIVTYYRLTETYRSADEFHQYLGEDIFRR